MSVVQAPLTDYDVILSGGIFAKDENLLAKCDLRCLCRKNARQMRIYGRQIRVWVAIDWSRQIRIRQIRTRQIRDSTVLAY